MKPLQQAFVTLAIGIAVVAFWRGVWDLMDVYLLPNNYELSSWISIIVGLVILAITHHWTKELV